nr:hypothetical protein GCM10020093_072910 [Planobispora longispora]
MADDDSLRIEWPEPDDGEIVLRHTETGEEHAGAELSGLAPGTWAVWKHGAPSSPMTRDSPSTG